MAGKIITIIHLCVRLHLPLAVVHLLLQGLQVGQEGLVELRQLVVLLRTQLRAQQEQRIDTQHETREDRQWAQPTCMRSISCFSTLTMAMSCTFWGKQILNKSMIPLLNSSISKSFQVLNKCLLDSNLKFWSSCKLTVRGVLGALESSVKSMRRGRLFMGMAILTGDTADKQNQSDLKKKKKISHNYSSKTAKWAVMIKTVQRTNN